MHPVLRQMKPPAGGLGAEGATRSRSPSPSLTRPREEGEGLARLSGAAAPERHPRVQLKREAMEAYVPRQNAFRERPGEEGEEMRDLRFRAGREMQLDRERVLRPEDFEGRVEEAGGVSAARAHMSAASLAQAYEQTVREEVNFQKTFNNNVRTLVSRDEVTMGLMHLWDFVEAFLQHPRSRSLTAQLLLIAQHCRDEGVVKEALLSLGAPESRWLVDLVNLLQTIVVQERSMSLSEKVAAINYSVVTLAKHYARKIYRSTFVPLDKEAKISTFYMRAVVKLLVLADDLGMYRNERLERVVSTSRRRELSDEELMFGLRRALAGEGDEGDLDEEEDLEDEALEQADMEELVQEEDLEEEGGPRRPRRVRWQYPLAASAEGDVY